MDIPKLISNIIKKNKNKFFLIDGVSDRKLTYGEFINIAYGFSRILKDIGLRKGERICVFMDNGLEPPVVYFGSLFSGVQVVPISRMLNKEEMEFIIKSVNPKLIIFNNRGLIEFRKINIKISDGLLFCATGKKSIKYRNKIDLISCKNAVAKKKINFGEIEENDPYLITFTSGTTGFPKGVVHCAKSIFENAFVFNNTVKIDSHRVFYHVLPMFYMAGILNMMISPFVAGATIIIGQEFSPYNVIDFWSIPVKYKVNTMWLVPSILSMLLTLDRDKEYRNYCKKSIKNIFVGTAPLHKEVKKRFEDKYSTRIFSSYGLSELLILTVHRGVGKEESVGEPIEGIDIKIVDDNGRELSIEREGEILVNSRYKMLGYIEHGKFKKVNGDWFATGDLGFIDNDNALYITGRKKEIIIRGGVNISPLAIERVVNKHPKVEFCIAIGIPDEYYGEAIALVLKLKPGYKLNTIKNELVSFCRANLNNLYQPTYYFEIDKYPFTATGKIKRSTLKEIIMKKNDIRC